MRGYKGLEAFRRLLPDDFSIQRYEEETARWGIQEWACAINARSMYQAFLSLLERDRKAAEQMERYSASIDFSEILEFPSKGASLVAGAPLKGPCKPSVSEITLEDLSEITGFLHEEEDTRQALQELDEGLLPAEELQCQPISGLIGPDYTALMVNLDASDEQLIQDFTDWLKRSREAYERAYNSAPNYFNDRPHDHVHVRKLFTEVHFERWRNIRVLPYIDLVLWCRRYGHEINHAIFEAIIFPDRDDTYDLLRRTVRKHAERLLKNRTVAALSIQASREKLAKNNR